MSEGDRLYELYGKPLEATHWGKVVAIAPDGRTALGSTLLEAAQAGLAAFGKGGYLFKVGEKAVGYIR